MNSTKIILITIISIALLSSTCRDEDCHDQIKIINNSDHAIYYSGSYRYPDTIPVANPVPGRKYARINSHSTGIEQKSHGSCFDGIINDSPGGKIMFFIYDTNTLETTPWDTIVKHYMILKRYDLTEQDLDSMGWTITYP
ncbi:MAG: hypothetical protein AB2L24_08600 [Mangrovibacterium sp.]